MTLSNDDLESYLNDIPPFGSNINILSVDRFRTLFRSCLKDMRDHRDTLKRLSLPHQETNRSKTYDINLLELASILCDTFQSTDMLELILPNCQRDNFKEYVSIAICNPAVNNEAVAQMLLYVKQKRNEYIKMMLKYHANYFLNIYEYASSLIFAYFHRRQTNTDVLFTHQDMTSTKTKIKRFFNTPRKAIKERNSSVFKVCFENASSEYSVEEIEELVCNVLASKLWYILHLILTNPSFKEKFVWKNSYINTNHPIFITMYMLNTFLALHKHAVNRKHSNAVKQLAFTELKYPYGHGGDELLVWLVCTYMVQVGSAVKEKYILSDILLANSSHDSTHRRIMCNLFIHFGVDVNRGNYGFYSPMCEAILDDDMHLVRILLYNNYALGKDNAVMLAFNKGAFRCLKVLLQCGAQLPQNHKADIINESLSYLTEEERASYFWIKEWLVQPHSLSFHCRKSLREHYGTALTPLLRSIGDRYPEKLKRYLRTEIL